MVSKAYLLCLIFSLFLVHFYGIKLFLSYNCFKAACPHLRADVGIGSYGPQGWETDRHASLRAGAR